MAQVRITGGVLNVVEAGEIDNSLPGNQPGIDNSLPIPPPPPGIWPPPVPAHPIVPIPPGGTKPPPGTIWPPVNPPRPDQGLPGSPPRPDQSLPPTGMAPHPSHPIASGTYWCLVYLPGFGWKYVVVDPSLHVDAGLPGPQPVPTPHK